MASPSSRDRPRFSAGPAFVAMVALYASNPSAKHAGAPLRSHNSSAAQTRRLAEREGFEPPGLSIDGVSTMQQIAVLCVASIPDEAPSNWVVPDGDGRKEFAY